MKVLFKWHKKCFIFDDKTDVYYLEIPKNELTDELIALMNNEQRGIELNDYYFDEVNRFDKNLSSENCAYILIDKEITRAMLCHVYYPYSGQWNGYCPFRFLYKTKLKTNEYLKNAIEIKNIEELKNIKEIIIANGYEEWEEE